MASLPNLPNLVRTRFKAAQINGDLIFYQTQVSILSCNGLPFQVRFSPALANKPKSNKPRNPEEKPFDPFSNPPEGLFITDLGSHFLVLNKFPVIPDHFILATKDYKEQTHLLEDKDLDAAYSCLIAYRSCGEELFGFFNSGEHSGASQPHRHIQFLPVNSMKSGMNGEQNWSVLADSLAQNPDLPFTYFSSVLPQDPTPSRLYDIYTSLLRKANEIVSGSVTSPMPKDGSAPISYNLGLTNRVMVLCPRTSEGTTISDKDGALAGSVSLNGTVLGGTLLVKSEAEWDALNNDDTKLQKILRFIGIDSTNLKSNERL